MQSESIKELAGALSKAQGAMKGAVKDSANPFFKSKYADLASVWDACREPLSSNGLSVLQTTSFDEKGIKLVTMLLHTSGEWVSGELPVKPVKDDPQGMGSAMTYTRRYGLSAIVGIAPEDDDGNAASGKKADSKESEKHSAPTSDEDVAAATLISERIAIATKIRGMAKGTLESIYAEMNTALDSGKISKFSFDTLHKQLQEKRAKLENPKEDRLGE